MPRRTPDRQDQIVDAVETLVDVAVSRHTNRDDETFTECHVCHEWEGHTHTCFVPALEQWLKTP